LATVPPCPVHGGPFHVLCMMGWFVLFAASLAGCLYIYFGYPVLILLLARLRPRSIGRRQIRPSLSIIIPVYNEERVIDQKLRNTLALEYPAEGLEILVVSDGSTDATEAMVLGCDDERLRLVCLDRQGKAFALNEGARHAQGEILVFTDANSDLEPDSLIHLVEAFGDSEVGGVCGNKKYRSTVGGDVIDQGENLYWRYDKWQKGLESRVGSIFAADGTLYAVRRQLFRPIEDPAQADDIAISTRVVLQGYRLVYEPRAVALEDPPLEGLDEFKRKVRVTNHSVRSLLNLGSALWTSGFYSVELLSHKFFRHLVPFFLISLFVSILVLAQSSPVFRWLLGLQIVFYALGLLGFALRRARLGRIRILSVPYYFCLVNAAALVGVLSIMAGWRRGVWTPRGGFSSKGEVR
jgi:cellulose synthase/poly-beta-1,6-N-acetylglucosamine synthase-like glycosyltransferase